MLQHHVTDLVRYLRFDATGIAAAAEIEALAVAGLQQAVAALLKITALARAGRLAKQRILRRPCYAVTQVIVLDAVLQHAGSIRRTCLCDRRETAAQSAESVTPEPTRQLCLHRRGRKL